MLACRIHAKEDLRIEPVDVPEAGPGEVLLRLGAAGICGSDLHYYFEGRNGNFIVREPLIPGHEASAVVAGDRRRRHPRRGRRQGRGVAVACVRTLRLLPRGTRAPVHADALPRQREPLPACAGDVPGIFRDGRAPMLSGRRRHLARRARVRRAARRGAARRQSRRRPPRQVGADHRRGDHRLRDRAGGAARGRAQGHGDRRARPAAVAGESRRRGRDAARRPRRRRAQGSAVRRRVRSVGQLQRAEDLRRRRPSAAASSCRWARCRTSRCRSSSTS